MRRTILTGLLAIALTVGLGALGATAAAKPPAEVDSEEAEDCETSKTFATTDDGTEVVVHHPCDGVETERCEIIVEDPYGMPQIVPYPCKVTINKPTFDENEPVDYKFCHEGHNFNLVPCEIHVGA